MMMKEKVWQDFEFFRDGIEARLRHKLGLNKKQLSGEIKNYSNQIRYLIIQADAYFQTAGAADLSVKPNLLYYGVISLSYALFMYRLADKVSAESLTGNQYQPHHGLKMVTYLKNFSHENADIYDVLSAFRAKILSKKKDEFFGTFTKFYDSIEVEYLPADSVDCDKKDIVFYRDAEFSLQDLLGQIPETSDLIPQESKYKPVVYIMEMANYYISMFIIGMMARYYSDFWVRWISQNRDYKNLMELFCGLVHRKFPCLMLCQFKEEKR